jgi:hypothetical protein
VLRPDALTLQRFRNLLERPIPPGPSALALAVEIWNRGFEIYLVGGTVRDVICGTESRDIDMVTTMPLNRSQSLISLMYGYTPTSKSSRGFIRIGGSPTSGDPFLDLKVFSDSLLGTPNATFGASFQRDVSHRDFACNAVYFDPVNEVLVDPTGIGIDDSRGKNLTLICSSGDLYQKGQIFIRFFKFRDRAFTSLPETALRIRTEYAAGLRGMSQIIRLQYIKAQILNKCASDAEHREILERIQLLMSNENASDIWEELFAPLLPRLLPRGREPG